VPFREITGVIGRSLNVLVVSKAPEGGSTKRTAGLAAETTSADCQTYCARLCASSSIEDRQGDLRNLPQGMPIRFESRHGTHALNRRYEELR
jgi:hypothetical protein